MQNYLREQPNENNSTNHNLIKEMCQLFCDNSNENGMAIKEKYLRTLIKICVVS